MVKLKIAYGLTENKQDQKSNRYDSIKQSMDTVMGRRTAKWLPTY